MTDIDKFYELLASYPFLNEFWDKEKNRVDLEGIEIGYFPSEYIVVNDVVLSIWNGQFNSTKVDITDLAALSPIRKKPLLEWLLNPFWP